MATYTTDLTTINTADTATDWGETPNPFASGQAPAQDTENFIQGTAAISQPTAQATGQSAGMEYNLNADYKTILTSGVSNVFVWVFFGAPTNIFNWSAGGWRVGFSQTSNNNNATDLWNLIGDDFGTYPYGGWQCIPFDPLNSPADQSSNGSPANWNYFVSIPNLRAAISKGSPHAVDAIRYGRGRLTVYGTGSSWEEIAEYNDYNVSGGTPPGTSSTNNDNGGNRLGLFSLQSGVYKWQGLLQFGDTTTNSVTFNDGNINIAVQDTPRCTTGFNKIEIRQASSSVTWDTVTISGVQTSITGSAPASPGDFEMIDNATVNFTGCSFTDLGTWIFQSNATNTDVTFRRCQQVTQGGGTFTSCTWENPELSTALISTPSTLNLVTGSTFSTTSATGNAVDLGTITSSATVTWNGNTLVSPSNRWTGVAGTDISSTANGAIKITATGSNNIVVDISVVNSAAIPSIEIDDTGLTGGGTLEVNVTAAVSITLTNILDGSEVRVLDSEDTTAPYFTPVEIAGVENLTGGVDVGGTAVNGTAGGTTNSNTFTFSANSGSTLYIKVFNVNFIADVIEDTYNSSQSVQINQRVDRVFNT